MATSSKSSTFGIIALIISVFLFFTPRFLLSLGMMALAVFTIIGLIRDGTKVFSVIAMLLGGTIFYFLVNESMSAIEQYEVEYRVFCGECTVNYTNSTGGTDKVEASANWSRTITAKGEDFLYLSVQNGQGSTRAKAAIYINGKLLKEEVSSGEYTIASASGRPMDINGK